MAKLLSGFLNTTFSTFDSDEVIQLIGAGAGNVLGVNTSGDYIESALEGFGINISNSSGSEGANLTFDVDSSVIATVSSAQTLTNKTIDLSSNTLTGNTAQFNTALSGDNFVTETASQTLTNKSLTLPTIGATGASFAGSSSGAINLQATAIAGSNTVTLPAVTGTLVTEANTATLTNKTINGSNNTFTNIPNAATTATDSNTANAIVARDASGNFSAGTITSSATDTATAATHYYVEIASDGAIRPKTLADVRTEIVVTAAVNSAAATTLGTVTSGTWNATAITDAYLATISTAGKVSNSATTATSANTANAIIARDASGNFSAGVMTGTATSARYADLAEKYLADQNYPVGTVMSVGGEAEITASTNATAHSIVGVVSGKPAYLMNNELEGGTIVALKGRVPVRVVGNVNKGDRLTVSDISGCAKADNDAKWTFAIALHSSDGSGVVEAIIL
jgi:hypothetical protein